MQRETISTEQTLQWVRGPKTAVSACSGVTTFFPTLLQWVRGPKTAVSTGETDEDDDPIKASMGPRSEDRG